MDQIYSWMEYYNLPFLSAFLLGILTAISPCPLSTNITATAFIAKSITDKKMVLKSGLMYALGRMISYIGLASLIYFGASKFKLAKFFNQNGEKFLGPLLILIGVVMLGLISFKGLGFSKYTEKLSANSKEQPLWTSLVLGLIFALAFCPYSGAIYFGTLIPLTLSEPEGLILPLIFAFATALPVLVFSYLLAYAGSKVGTLFIKVQKIETYMRSITGGIFILVGIYYILIFLKII